jgi:hypothetical protein
VTTTLVPRAARGPLALHALVGAVVIAYAAQVPCGSDQCLGPLYTGTSAVVWLLAAPLVRLAAGRSLVAWLLPFLWAPIAWAAALGLYAAFPSLAGFESSLG